MATEPASRRRAIENGCGSPVPGISMPNNRLAEIANIQNIVREIRQPKEIRSQACGFGSRCVQHQLVSALNRLGIARQWREARSDLP